MKNIVAVITVNRAIGLREHIFHTLCACLTEHCKSFICWFCYFVDLTVQFHAHNTFRERSELYCDCVWVVFVCNRPSAGVGVMALLWNHIAIHRRRKWSFNCVICSSSCPWFIVSASNPFRNESLTKHGAFACNSTRVGTRIVLTTVQYTFALRWQHDHVPTTLFLINEHRSSEEVCRKCKAGRLDDLSDGSAFAIYFVI